MSKNITIQEGGVAKQLTVDKLKTGLVGGGDQLWVPEDEVQLTAKHISENGTYKASTDGYYGYSEVTVSGIGLATGTDADGDEATVSTDGNGELVTTKIPSSIVVETPPLKISYTDGEAMVYTGMVVKAYLKESGLWTDADHPDGIIPISELTLPETASKSWEKTYDTCSSSLDVSPLSSPFAMANSGSNYHEYESSGHTYKVRYEFIPVAGINVEMISFHLSDKDPLVRSFFASDTSGTIGVLRVTRNSFAPVTGDEIFVTTDTTITTDNSYTINEQTVYTFSGLNLIVGIYPDACDGFPFYIIYPNTETWNNIGWTMIYGTRISGGYAVPVKWMRPGDYSILETTFTVEITGGD